MKRQRYIVSQLLNEWVVRDTELLKRRKRSIVYVGATKEDAEAYCNARNNELKARAG
jgi:hypothetical protein